MKLVSNLIEVHIFRESEKDLEFLLMKRSHNEKYLDIWQMVTGAIESGEKAYQTALREIYEETHLKVLKLWTVPNINSFYEPGNDYICFIPVFAALVSEPNIQLSKEHSKFIWVKKEEAKKLLAWEGQKKSVELIYNYYTYNRDLLNLVEINLK